MPRIARVVAPRLPYHVTQRGNRRQDVFFESNDRSIYKIWLADYAERYGLEIWAYCLMTNHVHLLVVGRDQRSLSDGIGRTHGRFAQRQNLRNGWTGHFWSGRFYSTPLDGEHLWAAVKYIELNPVRAGMVLTADQYGWSSARSHALGLDDPLLSPARPFPGDVGDWSEWLATGLEQDKIETLRRNTSTGRPTGSRTFIAKLEVELDRNLRPRKPGRKRRDSHSEGSEE